jgi:hypothetical protein
VNRLAAVIGVLVLVTGIVGSILHTGLFFVPALLVLAVGGVKLWREQSEARRAVLAMTGYLTRPLRRVVDQERSPLFKVAGGLSLGFPDAGIWQVDFFGQCRSLAEVRHDQMMAGGVRPGASACRGRPRGIPITLRGNSGHSLEGIAGYIQLMALLAEAGGWRRVVRCRAQRSCSMVMGRDRMRRPVA